MRKKILNSVILIVFLGFLFYPGCKTVVVQNEGDPGNQGNQVTQYTLTVTVGNGVGGAPAPGTYTYSENAVVNYSYSLEDGYKNLQVTLDGGNVNPSGNITMTSNHTLNANADPFDIRGDWEGYIDDNAGRENFRVTFSGSDPLSGNTSGTVGGAGSPTGAGTYTVTGVQIEFTLTYGFGSYTITGTLSNENQMSGDLVWTRADGTEFPGTWVLNRS